jgi:sugar lactone lactonase YvrE
MPAGIEIDAQQNLYVTEWRNQTVRKITPQGVVTTLAGTNAPGLLDGQGSAARLNTPDGITIDPLGNLYVAEHGNHVVRKIDANGNVVTIAGLGVAGFKDGDRATAMFNAPAAIMWHPEGSLWVSDFENHAIRRIEFLNGPTGEAAELLVTLNPALTIFGKAGARYRIEAAESAEWSWGRRSGGDGVDGGGYGDVGEGGGDVVRSAAGDEEEEVLSGGEGGVRVGGLQRFSFLSIRGRPCCFTQTA